MDSEEYESISKNDYRNLPEYRRFIPKKEKPESTEFGKNYHLIRAKPAEQLCLENTVLRKKMIVTGILFAAGLFLLLLNRIITAALSSRGIVMSDTAQALYEIPFVIAPSVLAIIGGLRLAGTINGPITIKDVQRYREAIRENWEKEQQRDARRPKHPPRKGERKHWGN